MKSIYYLVKASSNLKIEDDWCTDLPGVLGTIQEAEWCKTRACASGLKSRNHHIHTSVIVAVKIEKVIQI